MSNFKEWVSDNWMYLIPGILGAIVLFLVIMMVINGESLSDQVAKDIGGFVKKIKEASQ
jgi:MFS superfamily sulfate permease-like transporter